MALPERNRCKWPFFPTWKCEWCLL